MHGNGFKSQVRSGEKMFMKAVVWTKYGPPDVLILRDVDKPVPKNNEILVRIHATTVTAGDCELRGLRFPIYLNLAMRLWRGFLKPRGTAILGTELAGEVEATGADVKQFKPGDQIFGAAGLGFGANAEYICLPEKPGEMEGGVSIKPTNMTYEQAATVPFGGRDALHFLRKGNIQRGQKILINGAGGSIGTFAVQLAKYFGAEVTAVDSGPKLDMLRSIGADYVVDYTREDFTKKDEIYDIIFDVVGKAKFSPNDKTLKQDGYYASANPRLPQMIQGLWTMLRSSKHVILEPSSGTIDDLVFLRELVEAGKIKAVIDRRYPLEQIIEAHKYVETGQKIGNVVITV
jgi:NADPH:quinone reductase-like Zn-dependent oxidoreductase